ncbi:hypothetical protein UFOVP1516_9 [uncultured Caudovirales phage]|uniref:Uncharacterized protein n=1 Tax=uncultured Caudovirales phage TaxID=2100421 RepID=A0A6J7XFM7_9CAUD|nr:hypothetical protein UFOVP887_35 [uncultured Caudovirales phage]CAB5226693.1 hypothetical protein UFOVP1516_9 [uncultured Caudovirales phage]
MARNDQSGFFWDDYVEPKVKKEKINRIPPEPVWLYDSYLPGLEEATAFNVKLFTVEELKQAWLNKEPLIFDIECYRNYFLIAFKSTVTGNVCYWEMFEDSKLEISSLEWLINNFTLISFNGWNYDIPILSLALNCKPCKILKQATDDIIQLGLRTNDILKNYKCGKLKVDHIDLIEVSPLSASLKMYAGRLHCHKMQDLPFHPDKTLNPEQIAITRLYCINDLDNTILLNDSLKTELELRYEMSNTYNVDLRSKSDAQIAEAVIRTSLQKRGSGRIQKPVMTPGRIYHYQAPRFLKFQSPLMQWVLNLITTTPFVTSEYGKVGLPEIIANAPITMGITSYKMGIGGLHSKEKSVAYKANDEYMIKDVDVESYYPRIILNLGLFPEQLGRIFLNIYNEIVETRINAKRNKRKKQADSLKIVINGSFGKFGSPYSILYAPHLIIQTTITGQLSLLMLIERFELAGIQVVSANTDGVVSYFKRSQEAQFNAIVKQWEKETNFVMEETIYTALYSRDVNNYIAIKPSGEAKLKGAFSNHWNDNSTFRLHKNPTNLICIDAVNNWLTKSISMETTIYECRDITKFITVRDVKGGGVKVWSDRTEYLGKAIRWYYAKDIDGEIVYAKSGNKVARSEGAKPLMELPKELPNDINYDWYIEECNKILIEIGAN